MFSTVSKKELTSVLVPICCLNTIKITYSITAHIVILRISILISSFLSGSLSDFPEPDSLDDCLLELLHVVLKYRMVFVFGEKLKLPDNNATCTA